MHWTIRNFAGRRRARGAVGLAAIAIGLGAVGTACGPEDAAQLAAASYRMEPVDTAGANPFTPPAGADQRGVTPPPNAGGQFASNTAGLFGGTENISSCDPGKLVTFLEGHPDKAAAWAGVLGIQPKEIRTFVAGLTSVVLRSDTFVTNHGFENGRATTVPAVLQAGTAVLVDKFGAPVTKCFCGNPLTAPTRADRVTFAGTPWPSFSATNITIVQSSTVVINQFTLVEAHTGTSFDRPRGTDGRKDQHLATPPSPPPTAPAFTSSAPPTSSGTTTAPPTSGHHGPTSPPSPGGHTGRPPGGPPQGGPSPGGPPQGGPSPGGPSPGGPTGRPPQGGPTGGTASGPGQAPPRAATPSPGTSSASWVAGDCFVRGGTASGTVLVRNNDPSGSHTYTVTVSFGAGGEGSTSVSAKGGETSTATVTGSAGSEPDGSLPCEVTRVVDETGRTPTEGPALPKPPDTHPSPTPTTESPTPTTESPTPELTTESPTPEPPTPEPFPTTT